MISLDDVQTAAKRLRGVALRTPVLTSRTLDARAGAHVLVVRSTEVTASAIEAGEALALIVRAGAGVNTIDRNAASARLR